MTRRKQRRRGASDKHTGTKPHLTKYILCDHGNRPTSLNLHDFLSAQVGMGAGGVRKGTEKGVAFQRRCLKGDSTDHARKNRRSKGAG